jgi:hypothetical protein
MHDDDDQVLDETVTIRLALELRVKIIKAARAKGISVSEEVRQRLFESYREKSE